MTQMSNVSVTTDQCPVCMTGAAARHPPNGDQMTYTCQRCGTFSISGTAEQLLLHDYPSYRQKLSGWIYDQCRQGIEPLISESTLSRAKLLVMPTARERADRLLAAASRMCSSLGERFDIGHPSFIAATWSTDAGEVLFLLRILGDEGYARPVALGGQCEITPAGYLRLDELQGKRAASDQGFVAMWFANEMRAVFDQGFAAGIAAAGYRAMRVDDVEHAGRIDDEIIAQIRRSRFVVADFTGHRGGVYFEAGFAQGLGLPVIWTCRKDDMEKLHFDIRQFNCIDWQGADDLAKRLSVRIEAVLGRGPLTLRPRSES